MSPPTTGRAAQQRLHRYPPAARSASHRPPLYCWQRSNGQCCLNHGRDSLPRVPDPMGGVPGDLTYADDLDPKTVGSAVLCSVRADFLGHPFGLRVSHIPDDVPSMAGLSDGGRMGVEDRRGAGDEGEVRF